MNRTYEESRGIATYISEGRVTELEMEFPQEEALVRTPKPRSRESALVAKSDEAVLINSWLEPIKIRFQQ
jgi:hypothetical protein